MGVFFKTVAKDVLSDGGTGHAVEMGCGGMSEKMGVEMFVYAAGVRDIAENILQGPGRYTFSPFGQEQRSFACPYQVKISLQGGANHLG